MAFAMNDGGRGGEGGPKKIPYFLNPSFRKMCMREGSVLAIFGSFWQSGSAE